MGFSFRFRRYSYIYTLSPVLSRSFIFNSAAEGSGIRDGSGSGGTGGSPATPADLVVSDLPLLFTLSLVSSRDPGPATAGGLGKDSGSARSGSRPLKVSDLDGMIWPGLTL